MAAISDEYLIWCGPTVPAASSRSDPKRTIRLDTFPSEGNVFLKYRNISSRLAQNLPDIVKDMLEVASYVYCADQAVSRGGNVLRGDGADWRRNLAFHIPVRCLDTWNDPVIKDMLCDTLGFLSDDSYRFSFRAMKREIPFDEYFDFGENEPWFEADQVILFSGGLDSLAGLIDQVQCHDSKVVLVSHRPVAKISTRQADLLRRFGGLTGKGSQVLHVPVWVNKDKGLTRDTTQRTRSFLYVMIAASVASMFGVGKIRFFENGIISCNLPLFEQLVGARSSRTTHPRVLDGFSRLLRKLLERDIVVENPFLWKTKSEIVKVIVDSGLQELVGISGSCNHVRTTDNVNSHCGVCSQCIDRRIATLHNNLGENDSPDLYETDLFTGRLTKPDARTMAVGYVRFAQDLETMSDFDFFQKYPESSRILKFTGVSSKAAAESIFALHKRFGEQVGSVVEDQIREQAEGLRMGRIATDSLLGMVVGTKARKMEGASNAIRFPAPEGAKWQDILIEMLPNKSARISVGEERKTFTASDMGFGDDRTAAEVTKQWDVLELFAEGEGRIAWGSRQQRSMLYKKMQTLKKTLQVFFGLSESPIHNYRRGDGYVAKFRVTTAIISARGIRNFEFADDID